MRQVRLPGSGLARRAAGRVNASGGLSGIVRVTREVLPGDARFGDPLSTAGAEPAQVLARRVWAVSGGRWSVLAELGLAALQLADWLGPEGRSIGREGELAVLFTDLVGFSSWAVEVGDGDSLELLRCVDARVYDAITEAGGAVVKRLGDGTMAVFPDAAPALEGACRALRAARETTADGYDATLRAGLHVGSPQPIGNDFIGIDVNIAARLCEAAEPDEILMSADVAARLDGHRDDIEPRGTRQLRGVPRSLTLYALDGRDGDADRP